MEKRTPGNTPKIDTMHYTHARGKTFNTSKGKHELKRAESHHCEVYTLGIFACNSSMRFKGSQGVYFRKSLPESKQSDRF